MHADVLAHADVAGLLEDRPRLGDAGLDGFARRGRAAARLRLRERAAGQRHVAGGRHLGIGAHPQQRVARRPSEREHERVARERPTALGGQHRDRGDVLGSASLDHAPAHLDDLDPGSAQRRRARGPVLGIGDDHRTRAGLRRPGRRGVRRRAPATHRGGRCRGTRRGPRAPRSRRSPGRPRPRRAPRVRRAGPTAPRRCRSRRAAPRSRRPPRAPRRPGDRWPRGSRGPTRWRRSGPRRRGAPAPSAAAAAARPATPPPITSTSTRTKRVGLAMAARRREGAGARRPADHLLGEPPRPARTHEQLVVEAHRHRPMQVVGDRERVALGATATRFRAPRASRRGPRSHTRARPAGRRP